MKELSFTVSYRQPGCPTVTVLGVTSIEPLTEKGGVVFHTEDSTRFTVRRDQMDFKGDLMLVGMSIEFLTADGIEELFDDVGDDHVVVDHRLNSSDR